MTVSYRLESVMQRLECLMKTNAGLCMSRDEIETTTGISGRLLRRYCIEWWGTTLTNRMREVRLARVRRELQRFDPSERRIADIAGQYGMREAGRFAVQYRTQFGESPSTTLQRTKLRNRMRLAKLSLLGGENPVPPRQRRRITGVALTSRKFVRPADQADIC